MNICMTTPDRYFENRLHLAVFDQEIEKPKAAPVDRLVYASMMGIPESVRAVCAGVAEGRNALIGTETVTRFANETYKMVIKPIGDKSVAHGILYSDQATLDGLNNLANVQSDEVVKSYVFSYDGEIRAAVSDHLIQRFDLPREWAAEYPDLFIQHIKKLDIVRNPKYQSLYPGFKAVKIMLSEKMVTDTIQEALVKRRLLIPVLPLATEGKFWPGMKIKEYLTENMETLGKKLRMFKPMYVQGTPLHPAIGSMGRVPFPAQAFVIQGLYNVLESPDSTSVFCNADMGTGKSTIAGGIISILHHKNQQLRRGTAILLSAPSITLEKWSLNELKVMFPDAKIVILNNITEALALRKQLKAGYKPKGLEVYLVSLDRAKLGHEPYFAGIWKRSIDVSHGGTSLAGGYTWHCPGCNRPLLKKDVDGEGICHLDWRDVAEGDPPFPDVLLKAYRAGQLLPNGLPTAYKVRWQRARLYTECNHDKMKKSPKAQDDAVRPCTCKLYRPANKSRGETKMSARWNMSSVLKKMRGFFDLYICDEVHQAKGESSGRGDAFAMLCRAARKHLFLTGTLTTGRASSIKDIIWRSTPEFLLRQGFNYDTSSIRWAKRYGQVKSTFTYDDDIDEGWITRRKMKPQQTVEEPGISPKLTVQLLDRVAFLELPELGLPLVDYSEIVDIVQMDIRHQIAYKNFHSWLFEVCTEISLNLKKSGKKSQGIWSKFISATLGYANRPDLGAEVPFGKKMEGEDPKFAVTAPSLSSDYFHAKERRLVELVKENLAEDRGCIIYNHYTGKGGMNERIRDVLKAHGIEAVILNEPDTSKRDARLKELAAQGKKVVLTNFKLVSVGLDLLSYPSIFFYERSYEINEVRQASKRAHRVGQTRECRVYHLVYDESQEMKQFMHLVHLRAHALMTEGRVDKSQMASFVTDEQAVLSNDIASCIAQSGIADTWKTLAAKELEGVELVAEKDIQQQMRVRMRELGNETRRLCGLPPLDENPQPVMAEAAAPTVTVSRSSTPLLEEELEPLTDISELAEMLELFDLIAEQRAAKKSRWFDLPDGGADQLAFDF